jgi:hypothetical protein
MEVIMRKLALGVAAAAALFTLSAPAMAQVGFYAGPGGFSVGFGAPYYGYYPYRYRYYDYYGGPGIVVGPRWHRWHHHWRRW